MATNLKDCGPFASQHRADLASEDLRTWSALVQQGSELENARSYTEALKAYLAAEKIDDQYAELEFRIAHSLSMLGDYPGARQHFIRAQDLDTLRFRADSRINDINRAVASAVPGTELVDAEAIFSKESPNGIIGSELVYEHVHMTPLGNYLLAHAMFLQIASKLPVEAGRPTQPGGVPSEAECEQLLAFTGHDRARITAEMLQRLERPPVTNQWNHADQILRLTLNAGGPESPNDTAAQYEWAIRKKPDDRVLHYNYGLFLFDYNRAAAVEPLRMSRPWDDFPVFAPGVYNPELGTEDIVVVAELEREALLANAAEIEQEIRSQVVSSMGVAVRTIFLKPPQWIVKSTAGKVARSATREKLFREHPELDFEP